MAFKVLTLLIFFTGCLSFKENSETKKSENSLTQNPINKRSLNLTKRKDLYIGDVLLKYPHAKNITIVSGKRGSVSFQPEELYGSDKINVIYSNQYTILVTDDDHLIKIKRTK